MWEASSFFFHQRLFRRFQKGDRSASLVPAPCCPQGISGATSVPAHLAGVPQSKGCAHHLRTNSEASHQSLCTPSYGHMAQISSAPLSLTI